MKGGVSKLPPKKLEYRSFKTYDKDSFVKDLKQVPWSVINGVESIDDAVLLWDRLFSEVADQHAPLKFKRIKGNKNPWMTQSLIEIKRDRDYHYKKARNSNSPYHWGMYRKLRNHANQEERNLKSKYYCELINDAKNDGNKMWRAIKEVLPNTKGSNIFSILENGKLCIESHSIAKILNNYFVSIGKSLSKVFQHNGPSSLNSSASQVFHLQVVTTGFVSDTIKKLKTNKAVGLDKISARLLKDASDVIAPIIAELINKSFKDGAFPKIWKSAKVSALFKGGDKSLKDNYRPISILPTVSKIIEKAAHMQLCTYMETNNLLSHSQFGFRQGRSTSAALIKFTDQILGNMDDGHVTGAVFLDLRKAFDTVDHTILIRKLKCLGVTSKSLSWFHSYLTRRSQQTMCGDSISSQAKVTVGVPQGSILGPLLFLVYINGIQSTLQHSKMTMFADDMAFYCSANSADTLQNKLNTDLKAIGLWLNNNKLSLNVKKSKFMVIGSSNKLKNFTGIELTVGQDHLENVNEFKYLGVTINQHLTWHNHIEAIQSKVAQRLGVLKRIKHLLPIHSRKLYVSTMIIPILDYASIVWGDKNNKVLMNSLQVLQNKAAKLVLGKTARSSSSEALEELKWMDLSKRRKLQRCMQMYDTLKNNDEMDALTRGTDVHNYNTRSKNDLRTLKSRTNWGLQRTFNCCTSDWNALPIHIKLLLNRNSFKRAVLKYV